MLIFGRKKKFELRYPFTDSELNSLNPSDKELRALRTGSGLSPRFKDMIGHRESRLTDVWVNPGDDLWTPDKSLKAGGTVSYQTTLESTIVDGTQISNSTVETIVVPDYSIGAYYMPQGKTLRIWAFGVMSNVVTTPDTLTLAIRWGGVAGTVILQSAAQGLDTTARTNSLWAMLAYITCRTAGATGTFMSGGMMWSNVLSSTAANLIPALLGSAGTPLASGSAAVTVDTTTAKLLSVTAKFSVSTSPTNLTAQQRIIEELN